MQELEEFAARLRQVEESGFAGAELDRLLADESLDRWSGDGIVPLASADELAAELVADPCDTLLCGDGAIRYAEHLSGFPNVEVAGGDHAYPSARALVQLAHARALREDWIRPQEVELLYLRKPDAEINWSMREGA